MIGTLLVVIILAVAAIGFYQIFISDWLFDKINQQKKNKNYYNNVNKIAQVKMISDNAKDIESFVVENAQYLSDQTVQKLVSRIEEIKAGGVIAADDLLKTRIDSLPKKGKTQVNIQSSIIEEDEDGETNRSKRSSY